VAKGQADLKRLFASANRADIVRERNGGFRMSGEPKQTFIFDRRSDAVDAAWLAEAGRLKRGGSQSAERAPHSTLAKRSR
jgi:hypothetical protein